MIKRFKRMTCLPLSLLLMSASNTSYVRPYSKIKHENITCRQQLVSYSSESITTLSNIKNDVVAILTFNYEVYQMWKYTDALTTYHPSYIMMYQVDMYVNNAVQYKGGMFNWFNGTHAGFLDEITLGAKFNGTSNVSNSYQTPSLDYSGESSGLRFLKGVKPHDAMYAQPSDSYDKQNKYNGITSTSITDYLPHFIDTTNYYSYSYYYTARDYIYDPSSFMDNFDGRLVTRFNASQTVSSSSITYNQTFDFNNKLTITMNDSGTPQISNNTDDKLYSGPCSNGSDDSSPFYFTFYGVFGFESESIPSDVNISLYMHTYHGSHTALDTFDSDASKTFTIKL